METQCTPALFVGKSRKNIIFESPSLCLERFEYTSSVDGTKDWFVYHHEGTDKDCILILHGHGSHGDQLLKKPEWIALWERNVKKYNCNLLSPNLRDDAWMCPAAADDLTMILKAGLREKLWRRIIIIAGSMGASGGLIYAVRHPELIAGIAALGAATDIKSYQLWCNTQPLPVHKSISDAIKAHYHTDADYQLNSVLEHAEKLTMPVWFSHGGEDATIPVSQARALAEKMAGKKNFYYEEIPGGDHNSPLPFKERSIEAIYNYLDGGSNSF